MSLCYALCLSRDAWSGVREYSSTLPNEGADPQFPIELLFATRREANAEAVRMAFYTGRECPDVRYPFLAVRVKRERMRPSRRKVRAALGKIVRGADPDEVLS